VIKKKKRKAKTCSKDKTVMKGREKREERQKKC